MPVTLRREIDWAEQPLGLTTDRVVAERLGVTPQAVYGARKVRGIPAYKKPRSFDHFWDLVDRGGDGCWVWTAGRTGAGYGQCSDGSRVLYTHRIAYELTYGPIPDGLHVLHSCDNPPCCRPDHLFLGTGSDNMRDAVAKGRWGDRARHGPDHHSAKLTAKQVREIRVRVNTETSAGLAREFNVSHKTIRKIRDGRSYRNVPSA